MLTNEERVLVRRLWSTGPSVLFDLGYPAEKVYEFIMRPDVVIEMSQLDAEFKHGQTFEVRAKYLTRREMTRLSSRATETVERAMEGPKYAKDPDGNILRDARGLPIIREPETTPVQLRAAETVLASIGVENQKSEYRGDVQINALLMQRDSEVESIELDATSQSAEQQALSRERMRNAIERLLKKLPEVRDRVTNAITPEVIDVKPTKVVKRKNPKNGSSKEKT